MNCPACSRPLHNIDAGGGVRLDVCDAGCGGIWFDNFELEKFDEAHEVADSPIFAMDPPHPLGAAGPEKRVCPRCETIKMRRFFFSAKRAIEIDQCANCGGDWLDFNELVKIRGEFANAEAREQAATDLFGATFDAQLAEARAESQAKVKEAEKFQKLFDFLNPFKKG